MCNNDAITDKNNGKDLCLKKINSSDFIWGYGAVGSAFEWHSKGQRFESA